MSAVALTTEHAARLARFRIPPEMLESAGVRSLTDAESRETLGLNGHRGDDLSGIFFPYLSPLSGRRTGGRTRLDRPLSSGGKYVSEPGCRHLFFPPSVAGLLSDAAVPVVIVEAEKSALALTALAARAGRKMMVIAIGGCWGWRRKAGLRPLPGGGSQAETGPSPDLALITWEGRTVILALDSNAASNSSVQRARDALVQELAGRGARVAVTEMPIESGVNGPDDLVAVAGDEAALRVLDTARPLVAITLQPGALPAAVDQAEEVLLLAHCERLMIFQRAGELVRVICLPESRRDGGLRRPAGSVQLDPLSGVALTEVFDRVARWQRINREGEKRIVDCPPRVATAYLSRVGSWRVPVLAGIISAPIMREDGEILARPGYNEKSGLLFVSDAAWPPIPDRPTHADAKAALQTLLAPFAEFPFVAEEDKAVHVACILTAIQRRLLGACPIFGYSAPAQRSGKSLLAETVAILATGKPAPATAVSGEREEIRKAITSALREGHSIINLDNIEVPLSSPDLARAITQREYQDRVLGGSRMVRLPTNVLWTATGNNLVFRGDLSSRALLSRIDSGLERPEQRTFRIPHLEAFLAKKRAELVVAALTILRAYHVAGRPNQNVLPWGGFDNWSESVREPLIWVGLADPCKTREAVLEDDPEREESAGALRFLDKAFAGGEFTVKEVVERCGKDESLKDSILGVAAGRQHRDEVDSRCLGWWLRRVKDRIIGGLRLHSCGRTSGVTCWKVVKVTAGSVGGSRGFRDHFPATEGTNQPVNGCLGGENNAGRRENDHQNPRKPPGPQAGDDDEVVV